MIEATSHYREWDPPPAWRAVVACCWEQVVGVDQVQRVLPDGRADLIVYSSGLVEVVGLADTLALPVLPAGTRLRGVRLRPEAVAAAFRTTGSSLLNRTVGADDVLGARQARALRGTQGVDRWVRSITPSARATEAARLLASLPVDHAAERLGMSGRHLRRVMLDDVGLGPKAFQRVLRLQRFVRLTDHGAPLAAASAEAGYADQAHASREVLRMAGVPPARLVEERHAS